MNNFSSRLDVLFLIRSMGRGGAERQLSLLARAMQARGLRVAVAVFYGGGALEGELRDAGVEVVDLKKAGRWSNIGMLRRLVVAVRKYRPRIFHSYMPTQNIVALLLKSWLKRNNCAVVCGVRAAKLNFKDYGLALYCLSSIHVAFLKRADLVIFNSSRCLSEFGSSIRSGFGVCVPNGIDQSRFAYIPQRRNELRGKWGVPDTRVLIGLVGRLHPEKNHKLLLEALAQGDSMLSHVDLVFVGESKMLEYSNALAEYARKIGLGSRLIWAGAVDNMSTVYSSLDALCLCSLSEGFPNVLGEAMSAGLPCITTDVGDAAMLVGDCGWVVPPGDRSALVDALVAVCRALPTWDRTRPLRRVEAEFSVDALTNRTITALTPYLGDGA